MLHGVGYLGFNRIACAELRGDANQKTHNTDLKQISLREVQCREHPSGNVNVKQPPTYQRYPAEVVGDSPHQLQSSDVAHGKTSWLHEVKRSRRLAVWGSRRIIHRVCKLSGRLTRV